MKRSYDLRMISYIVTSTLLLLPTAQAIEAVQGVTDSCCSLAIQKNAYIGYPSIPSSHYVCGQSYSPDEPPAADLKVNLSWCQGHCGGYKLYAPGETSDWAVPLVSFILPAVIFSTQIPRRLGLKPLPRYTGKRKTWVAVLVALLILPVDMLLIVLDTTGWVFAIMIGAGPSILSGLVELWLDYKVTCRATNGQANRTLTLDERIEAFTAVLTGNLLIEGVPYNAQDELRETFLTHSTREEVVNGLLSMLESQMTFGGAVGAAILLYLGSYVYTLSTLSRMQGDQATARALAFGIWWMTIVHVSVIGGSLLASNNPSTAAAIVKRPPKRPGSHSRTEVAGRYSDLKAYIQTIFKALSRIPLIYETRYEPAWMWSRGKNKGFWLSKTSAWEDHDWFSDIVHIRLRGWLGLFVIAYLLVLAPCGLAFWIEYRTPPVTVGCRSMTILLYMVAQTIFMISSAWSHFKAFRGFRNEEWCGWLRRNSVRIRSTISTFAPAWLSAVFTAIFGVFTTCLAVLTMLLAVFTMLLAVFTTFVGTLMQITGIFQNCSCAATYTWAYRSDSTVSLAKDTQSDRASSGTWKTAGRSALAVLGAVTLIGWYCQRYIRDVFIERVQHLLDAPSDNTTSDDTTVLTSFIDHLSNQNWWIAQPMVTLKRSFNGQQASTWNGSNDVEQDTPPVTVPPQIGTFDLPRIPVTREDSVLFEPDRFQLGR